MPMTTSPALLVEEITPEVARELLSKNDHNRNLRATRVNQLVQAMRAGEWELNGETIKIADDGTLIDGQHRLQAVVESGVTISALVMRDLPMEVQDTVDTGRRRRLADVLAIEGYSDSHALGAAVNILYRYRQGTRIDYSHGGAPTPQQALELIEEEPGIIDSVKIARRVAKKIKGPLGVYAALHHVFGEVDRPAADEFFEHLEDGADLSKGDPLLSLRSQIYESRTRNYAQTPYYIAALMIKAFNMRREGRYVKTLSFKNTEKFPALDPPRLGEADGT